MKPILFNTEMVKAILDGRKTVTRRVVKPQLQKTCLWGLYASGNKSDIGKAMFSSTMLAVGGKAADYIKPPYKKGDILYVRETWQKIFETEYDRDAEGYCVNIRNLILNFDDIPKVCAGISTQDSCAAMKPRNKFYVYGESNIKFADPNNKSRWRPSIHMPKEAARIFLKVTDVRVERLQDITEEQALKEGVLARHDTACSGTSARIAFAQLWDSILPPNKNKFKYPENQWLINPWVWVIEFERIEKP